MQCKHCSGVRRMPKKSARKQPTRTTKKRGKNSSRPLVSSNDARGTLQKSARSPQTSLSVSISCVEAFVEEEHTTMVAAGVQNECSTNEMRLRIIPLAF